MIRDAIDLYRPHGRLLALDVAASVLAGLLSLAFPLAVTAYVDRLLPQNDWMAIVVATLALLALYVLNVGLILIITYCGHVLGIAIETALRQRAFDHLQTLSPAFFDRQKTGHLVARLTKDLEEVGEVAHHGPEDLLMAMVTLVGAFALMATLHVPLALITLAVMPVVMTVLLRFGRQMTQNWRAQFDRLGDFNARLEEVIGGARVIRAFAAEDHERRLFTADNERYREVKRAAYRIMALSQSANYFGLRFVQVVVLLAGTWFVQAGSLSIGGFVGFLLLVNVFYQPLEKIAAIIEIYPKGIAGFRRCLEFLAVRPTVTDAPTARPAPPLRGDIRFESVTFGYAPDRPVLRDFSLRLDAGRTYAFVGPSGVGKTTLLSLLPRFYAPTAGRITIDGIDIAEVTARSLRLQIGIVQQDVFLFAGTLRDNIAYGRPEAGEAAIREAVRRARLDDLVESHPDGLSMRIGERGVMLSGGQRQRVAIARIFLKNPPILVLDEATSALDTETERAIQSALRELAQGRTTLMIAHRLATVRDADRIIVMTHEGIVEQGTHAELMARRGFYHGRLHGRVDEDDEEEVAPLDPPRAAPAPLPV